jgi:hypothetical protein
MIKLIMKLASEVFLAEAMVAIGRQLAKATTNELDDELVASVAKALNVTTVDKVQ